MVVGRLSGFLLGFVLLALLLLGCGGPPGERVSVSVDPVSVTLDAGASQVFTATVTGTGDTSVSWSASGGVISGDGLSATYRAPEEPGSFEVTVTSNADVSRSAVAAVTVLADAPLRDETVVVGGEGGDVIFDRGDPWVRFPSGALKVETPVRVRVYDRDLTVGESHASPIGLSTVVDVEVASLNLEDGNEFYVVAPSTVATDDFTLALVILEFDGGERVKFAANYEPGVENVIVFYSHELRSIFESHGSVPERLRIEVQPTRIVSISSAAGPASLETQASTTKGLYKINPFSGESEGDRDKAVTLCDSKVEGLPWRGWESAKSGNVDAGKTPLVFVHGWMTLANAKSKKVSYNPALCEWYELIWQLTLNHNVRTQYDFYTFGYDSSDRIASSTGELGEALRAVFGDQPVVLVGHSMGGMVANAYVQGGGASSVHHVVTLGSPHRGSRFLICEEANSSVCNRVRAMGGLTHWIWSEAVSAAGTKDLAWEFGGVDYPSLNGKCEADCNIVVSGPTLSDANPYLETLNGDLNSSKYANYTAFVGTGFASSWKGFIYGVSGAELNRNGYVNDGIVPAQSACLSTATGIDNGCLNSVIGSMKYLDFNHTGIREESYFDLYPVLVAVAPTKPVTPEEPGEPSPPAAFTLSSAEVYCTTGSAPAVRLRWSESAGAEAYEVHRDGSLYAELETLNTTFENTSNVTAGQAYEYLVRAKNSLGDVDSAPRSVSVPADVCDSPPGGVDGADLIIQSLSVDPSSSVSGGAVTVSFDVRNQGDEAAGASTTRIRVNSSPSTVTTSDTLLRELSTPAVAAGGAQFYSETVTLPSLSDGTYYVWVTADVYNVAGQSNYDNDRAVRSITVGDGAPGDYTPCSVAGEVIAISDPGLEDAIRVVLGIGSAPLTCSDMQELDYLSAYDRNIHRLDGLQHATNLTYLNFWGNQVSDVGPVANLTNLTDLSFGYNQVSDVGPVANLTNLTYLDFWYNQVSDIGPVANLTNLTYLYFADNQVSDVGPLVNNSGLQNDTEVRMDWNCIDISSGSIAVDHISELLSRGVDVHYEPQDAGCVP